MTKHRCWFVFLHLSQDKQTIAEYVEILEQLRDIGIGYAQGYAVGKPMFLE